MREREKYILALPSLFIKLVAHVLELVFGLALLVLTMRLEVRPNFVGRDLVYLTDYMFYVKPRF